MGAVSEGITSLLSWGGVGAFRGGVLGVIIGKSSLMPPYADPTPAYPGVTGDLVSSTEAHLPPLLIRIAIGVASPGKGIALILADRRGLADLDRERG